MIALLEHVQKTSWYPCSVDACSNANCIQASHCIAVRLFIHDYYNNVGRQEVGARNALVLFPGAALP